MYKRTDEGARDEHAVIGGVAGKKVFVVDNAGNQITSFGGGATVSILGNVTLSDSKAFIGLVTSVTAYTDTTNSVGKVEQQFSFLNYTSASTVAVKTGAGFLHTLVINKRGTGTTAIIYDSLVPSGTKIATIDTTLSTTAFVYDVKFSTGLTLDTVGGAGAADLTISYR